METIKDILKFCNGAVFYDYTNIGITVEMNQVRKCITNTFYKTIPDSRRRVSLSIIDDIFFRINNIDIENFIENIHDLREKIIYMLAFEKLIRDEQRKVIEPILNDESYFIEKKVFSFLFLLYKKG